MGATQRLRQGFRALFAFTEEVDSNLVQEYLSPSQYALFQRMSHSEQLHSVNVLQGLLNQEESTPIDLAVAGLLHDVGKSRYKLAVWQRTLAVLSRKFIPDLYRRLSQQEQLRWWNAGCIVAEHHPEWSAQLAEKAGVSKTANWLIKHHQDKASQWADYSCYNLLLRLQAVDNEN